MTSSQSYRCHVLSAGTQLDNGRVAVQLVGLDPLKAIGWRYAGRMPEEVLATAMTAISADLQVACVFAGDHATGDITAFNLLRRRPLVAKPAN